MLIVTKSKNINKPKRKPCPFCKELIIKGAKKCHFCNEILDSNKPKNKDFLHRKLTSRTYYWMWLISCLSFFTALILINADKINVLTNELSIILTGIIIISIFIGSTAFLGLILTVLTSLNKSRSRWYALATIGGLFVFFMLLTNQSTVSAKLGLTNYKSDHQLKKTSSSTLQKTVKPTEGIKKINDKNKDSNQKKIVQPTQIPDQSNQPVHCNIHPNCGGGSTPLTKAECEKSICCQIDNKWIFYKDNKQCEKDQRKNSSKQTLIKCETDLGTYQLSKSDCDYYQQLSKSQQNSNNYQPTHKTIEPIEKANTTQSNSNFDYEQYEYEMLQALEACKADARHDHQTAISKAMRAARASGGQLMGTDRLDKQLERDIEYCKSLYQIKN